LLRLARDADAQDNAHECGKFHTTLRAQDCLTTTKKDRFTFSSFLNERFPDSSDQLVSRGPEDQHRSHGQSRCGGQANECSFVYGRSLIPRTMAKLLPRYRRETEWLNFREVSRFWAASCEPTLASNF
jgi:hypothetical protein